MRDFCVVAVGRNKPELMGWALHSIVNQDDRSFRVCMVDDASTDDLWPVMRQYSHQLDVVITNAERLYALANQIAAWKALEPDDDDVIVFVDLDDALWRLDALSIVRAYYEAYDVLLTYGSYTPVPVDHPNAATCRPAAPYHPMIIGSRSYRQFIPQFNHLRTVSWSVLKHLTEEDLRNDDGVYWRANTDRAVMIPALEMAGDRAAFIPEILYGYRCDLDDSIVRTQFGQLVAEDEQLRHRPKKGALV